MYDAPMCNFAFPHLGMNGIIPMHLWSFAAVTLSILGGSVENMITRQMSEKERLHADRLWPHNIINFDTLITSNKEMWQMRAIEWNSMFLLYKGDQPHGLLNSWHIHSSIFVYELVNRQDIYLSDVGGTSKKIVVMCLGWNALVWILAALFLVHQKRDFFASKVVRFLQGSFFRDVLALVDLDRFLLSICLLFIFYYSYWKVVVVFPFSLTKLFLL